MRYFTIVVMAGIVVFLSGCAQDNKNITTPSSWQNIKEDRYSLYDVADYETDFIQDLQSIMDSLNPDALNSTSSKQKTQDSIQKYF